MTDKPLMPKATAVWLVDNTLLTFDQIAEFVGLHPLEIQAIADGDVAMNIVGKNPVLRGILDGDELKKAEKDPSYSLTLIQNDVPQAQRRSKGPKYTPVTKRADKPNGIAYLIKNYPNMSDAQIIKLIGTTKSTIEKIRNRTHYNIAAITPQDPVQIGLCKRSELDAVIEKMEKAAENKAKKDAKKKAKKKETAAAKQAKAAESAIDNAVDANTDTQTADENEQETASA